MVKVPCYKSEGRLFDPSWCHKILPIDSSSKGAHTRTSPAHESASGSLTQEPGSDIFHHTCMSGFPNFARTFQYPE